MIMNNIWGYWRDSKKELVDAFYLVILQGVNLLLPIIIMPYLMVTLGANQYGYIGFSQSMITYLILIVDFGFNLSATKRIALVHDDKVELSRIFYSTLFAKIILLLFCFIIFAAVLSIRVFEQYSLALICSFPMVIGSAFTFFWMFQGIGKIRHIAIINTVSKIMILPLIFIFVKRPDDYPIAALIQSSVYVLTGLISCLYLIKLNIIHRVKISMNNIKLEFKESFPLFLSIASTSIYCQLFVVILGVVSTPAVVGKYSAAEKIMRALCTIFYVPISQAFFQKVSILSQHDYLKAKKTFHKVIFLTVAIMIMAFLVLFVGGDFISDFLGKEYVGLNTLLKIFSLAPIAIGVGGVLGQLGLVALGNYRTKILFQRVYFIVAPVSLILVVILAPIFMEVGAAWALVITEYLVFLLMLYYTLKNLKS